MSIVEVIRNRVKRVVETVRNEKVKNGILQALPFWIASLLTGLVAVLYTRLFSLAEKGTAYIVHKNISLLFLITPCCFLASWWIVKRFSPYSRGSGIPQVMASIELATPKNIEKVNRLLS